MKEILMALLVSLSSIFFVQTQNAQAQTIYFCEDVDSYGDPINAASTFNIGSGGGWLYVMLHNDKPFNCTNIIIDIYKNGKFETTINVSVEPDWDYFAKQITFYSRGTYTIYIYDSYEKRLGSKKLTINMK